MGVDVHVSIGNHQVDGGHGIAFHLQQAAVGLLNGKGEHPALDQTAVHEERQVGSVGAADVRRGSEPLDGISCLAVLSVHFQHALGHLRPIHSQQRLAGLAVAGSGQGGPAIIHQPETDFRKGQGIAADQLLDPRGLRLGRTKELASRGLVAE